MELLRTKLKLDYILPSGNILAVENEYEFKEDEDIASGMSKAREILAETIANGRPDVFRYCLAELGIPCSMASLKRIRENFYNTCKEIDSLRARFLTNGDRLQLLKNAIERAEALETGQDEKDLPEEYFNLLKEIFLMSGVNDYIDYMATSGQKGEIQGSPAEET